MKKIIFLGWLALFLVPTAWAQEKLEAPVWNVGDKWVFTRGNIEVVDADQDSYTVKLSKDLGPVEKKRLEKMVFDKSSLNKTYMVKDGKRERFTLGHRRILNFPISLEQEWKDTFSAKAVVGPAKGTLFNYKETFKVVGWENVKVQAGTFKAIKLEYFQESSSGRSGTAFYWYAPEVKYFVKCEYEQKLWKGAASWELASFKLKE